MGTRHLTPFSDSLNFFIHRQVVSSKLIGPADIVLRVVVVAPCDENLYQSSVLLKTKNDL